MPAYNFKTIGKVPDAKMFIDVILSMTQRKTPTVIRRGFKISRIIAFYTRKVKYTASNFRDKLTSLLEMPRGFPILDDMHPFYGDLINVLYSRDHYKLALGQINTVRTTIDNIAKDFIRLISLSDSLFRCKELKRSALGRMCTAIKKLAPSLAYLEQVRQHMSRLSGIDPSTRTLLISGYPNTGKSSFLNQVSRANVDVQSYAFSTQSLFVGHTDYEHTRWQVIDTPGILDHALEQRNIIEMQAITALAHLQATVLFFIDISEDCGYTVEAQVSLFHNIKELFQNKPVLIVANKTDLTSWEDLDADKKALIEGCAGPGVEVMPMSNATGDGVAAVKSRGCMLLLQRRAERKLNSQRFKPFVNQLNVALPVKRDNKARPVNIHPKVLAKRAAQGGNNSSSSSASAEVYPKPARSAQIDQGRSRVVAEKQRKTLKDVEAEYGGAGVFSFNLQHHWKLENPEEQFDIIPQIYKGKNIADYIDPDIDAKMDALLREEDELEAAWNGQLLAEDDESGLDEDDADKVTQIRTAKVMLKKKRIYEKNNNGDFQQRGKRGRMKTRAEADADMASVGLDSTKFRERSVSVRRGRERTKRNRDTYEADHAMQVDGQGGAMDIDGGDDTKRTSGRSKSRGKTYDEVKPEDVNNLDISVSQKKRFKRSESRKSYNRDSKNPHSRVRSISKGPAPRDEQGLKDAHAMDRTEKHKRTGQKGWSGRAMKGEGDRRMMNPKDKSGVKHMLIGKRGIGKTDRR
jgi:nucleolar GTP-binding protein